jgi:hypothetical protein
MKTLSLILSVGFLFVISCKNERDTDIYVPPTTDSINVDDRAMDETMPMETDTTGIRTTGMENDTIIVE